MQFTQGHALVVGVGADLPITVKDAQAIHDLLVDPARCAYPASQVTLLTNANASRGKVLSALDSLAVAVNARGAGTADTTVLVYYSGHGERVTVDGEDNYYLLTHGYALDSRDSTCIRGEEFAAALARIEARKLIVLLDCCFAGGFDRTKAPGMDIAKATIPFRREAVLARGQGRTIFASSTDGEKSLILQGEPYSAYTTALLEALTGTGGHQTDGFAYLADVWRHVDAQVPQRTRNRQHPVMHANGTTNFALAYYAGGAKSPNPLPWMKPQPGDSAGPPPDSNPAPTPGSSSGGTTDHATWKSGEIEKQIVAARTRRATQLQFIEALKNSRLETRDPEELVSNQLRLDRRLADLAAIDREIADLEAQLHG